MFDIQELNDMVFKLLKPQDLAKCVRVSKEWHSIVIPYLWGDLSWLDAASITQKRVFGALLLESYHHEQRQRETWDLELGLDHLEHSRLSNPPSVLAKYGPCVRVLPDLSSYLLLTGSAIQTVLLFQDQGEEQPEESNERRKRPTGWELLLHLFKHCKSAQPSLFCLEYGQYKSDDTENVIAEFILPRVRHLTVHASYHGKRGELWKLRRLLGQCSTTLEKLTLEIDYQYGDSWSSYVDYDENFDTEEEEPETVGSTEWPSLKELILYPQECVGNLQPTTFWSWLYKQCGQVERIEISNFRRGAAEGIAENMSKHMPHLNEITIGDGTYNGSTIKPDRITSLLSGSRNGWKVIRLMRPARFMSYSMDEIRKHFSTLEAFYMDRSCTFDGNEMVEILSSSPNLHTLCGGTHCYQQDPKVFIGQDPETRVLKAWACELSLKVLRLKVGGIPRPESEGDQSTMEEYLGQRREIQGLMYDRLARLTNLETLSLGDLPEEDTLSWLRRTQTQEDCLEMSLESGLHKLSKLTKLKELNVLGMKTKIGVKEVQWMTEHWPRLRVLRGLRGPGKSDDDGKQAMRWLQEHHPEIDVMRALAQ